MSNDEQQPPTSGALATIPTSRGTQNSDLEDVDLYAPSTPEIASIATSKDSVSSATALNTQANAQRAPETQEAIKSVLHTNDVPFVRTPSPIYSLTPELSPKLSHNNSHMDTVDSRRDSAVGNDSNPRRDSSKTESKQSSHIENRFSSRKNSNATQNSHSRLNSDSRRDSTTRRDSDTRQNSYTRRISDPEKDLVSRKGSDIRQNLDSRKESKDLGPPLEPMYSRTHLPLHPGEEYKSAYTESPLNPANTHEDSESRHRSSRHHSSRRLPTPPVSNSAIPANPYAGRGLYPTPQMYASPLPVPQYVLPPPVDYSHIYSPNARDNSHLPPATSVAPVSFIYPGSFIPLAPPTMPGQPSPASRPSASANIVATVAMTPEMKSLRSLIDSTAPPDTSSFADNNPYRLRSKQERSSPDLRSYSGYGPTSLPPNFQPIYPGQAYPRYSDAYSSVRRTGSSSWRAPSAAFSPPIIPQLPDGSNSYRPYSPGGLNTAAIPSAPYRHGSYDSRRRSHSHVDTSSHGYGAYYDYNPPDQHSHRHGTYYDHYPPRQKTSADVVAEASNIPAPERKKTQSFTDNEPYRGSGSRRDTVIPIPERKTTGSFADHNPYRLPSRRTTVDVPAPPPPPPPPLPTQQPTWGDGDFYAPRSYSARRRSSSLSRERDYYGYGYSPSSRRSPTDRRHRHSSGHRRSPSLDYSRHSGSRRRRRSYSPFKYGYPGMMPIYPTIPYLTPSSSAADTVPLRHHRHNLRRPGFWSRVSTFFKSPFDRGRPHTMRAPYPRAAEEPVTWFFVITVIIGQVYFHILLRLPSLYFSRVSRIFDEANLNIYEITEMVFETSEGQDPKEKSQTAMHMQVSEPVAPKIRPQYERLKNSWESFVDSLIREWETFNIVSVMLLTAILTILQITSAASDPVTRYAALFSLICSLVSLLFGCMYIIRFGTMRKTYAAVEWAKSALGSSQSVIWNVWVLLSMPAVWLTWSIILFIVSIMSYVWRTNPASDHPSTFILSSTGLLIVRIAMSAVLGLGLANTMLITKTFRLYGEALDKDWRMWIDEWQKAKAIEAPNANVLTPGNIPPDGYGYNTPYLNYGLPLPSMTPLPTPGSVPVPPVIPPFPYPYPYADLGDRKERSARRQRRHAAGRYQTSYPESDSSSTSSSESSSSRRRARRRSRSSPEPPQYVRPSSRDPPTRSNLHASQTPRIPEHDLPPHVVSPIPRYPARSSPPNHPDDAQNSHGAPDTNTYRISPFIPPLVSDNEEENDPQGRNVRFRSPLESTRGSSDWGVYDSSLDYSSPKIMGPSSSSASGITQESSNVQIQNPDALRRRRPTS